MTDIEILQAAMIKAYPDDFETWDAFDIYEWIKSKKYHTTLFSHDFAKAFWKEDQSEGWFSFCEEHGFQEKFMTKKGVEGHCPDCGKKLKAKEKFNEYAWQNHLQQMVLEDNPIQYLAKSLGV